MRHSPGHAASGSRGAPAETSAAAAVDWAEVAAMLGDFREAVSWLGYVEWLQGPLSPELAALRARWESAAGPALG